MTEPTLSAAPQPALEAAIDPMALEAACKASWEEMDDEIGWDASKADPRMSKEVEFHREQTRLAIAAYSAAQQKVPETVCPECKNTGWTAGETEDGSIIQIPCPFSHAAAPAKPQPPETGEEKAIPADAEGAIFGSALNGKFPGVGPWTDLACGQYVQQNMPNMEGMNTDKYLQQAIAHRDNGGKFDHANAVHFLNEYEKATRPRWTCFYCSETFTDRHKAEEHFRRNGDDVSRCDYDWLYQKYRTELATIRAETVAECAEVARARKLEATRDFETSRANGGSGEFAMTAGTVADGAAARHRDARFADQGGEAMSDLQKLIKTLQELAAIVGLRFVPDPEKIARSPWRDQ